VSTTTTTYAPGEIFAMVANEHGGASMDIASGVTYSAGDPVYFVGGEPDRFGKAIPEMVTYGPMTSDQADAIRESVRFRTGNRPGAVAGTWHATDRDGQPFVSDASRGVRNRRVAVNLMFTRGEDAIWDMARMAEIGNKVKARRASGRPIYREPLYVPTA
jgi:hypothetical protein